MTTVPDAARSSSSSRRADPDERTVVPGATPTPEGTTFALWSTQASSAAVRLYRDETTALDCTPMKPLGDGVFAATLRGVGPGALYKFELDGAELPDPYARYLPYGVHGPARVEPTKPVEPLRPGLSLERAVLYEIHLGTFTPEGTYRAAQAKLPHLAALGVTAIELMPLSSFAGGRGWGYDGVAHYAPFPGYGDPDDLRAFVEAAHALGLGVIGDVVYNHFGPAGSYLASYAPEYFTARHKTAWGDAPDFANPFLRRYVLDNVRYWLVEFGFDGLRLDATHGILDDGTPHVLEEIAALAHSLEPRRLVFAEDDRNDPSLVTRTGLDALWADDFHHDVHVTLTGEQDGYYGAYRPGVAELARTIERGWLYEGQVNPVTGHARGAPADGLRAANFVYCIQNHDQIGNRAFGSRLNHDVSADAYATASMLLLFLPMTPILFMGQEWAATAPFLFFTDHEPELGALITKGRREEFEHFDAFRDAAVHAGVPDPQALETFQRCRLNWSEREDGTHARTLALYRTMLALRRDDAVLASTAPPTVECVSSERSSMCIRRSHAGQTRALLVNFGKDAWAGVDVGDGLRCIVSSRPGAWSARAVGPMSAVLLADDAAGV